MRANDPPGFPSGRGWLGFVQRFDLVHQLYFLLLVAALPLCAVAAYQAASSWIVANEVARSFPIFELADRREERWSVVRSGVEDAVDTGAVSAHAVGALRDVVELTARLEQARAEDAPDLRRDLALIEAALGRGRSIDLLLPLRQEVFRSSQAIKASSALHHARLVEAIDGRVQTLRRDVVLALAAVLLSMGAALRIGRQLIAHILRVERQAAEMSMLNQAIMDAAPIGVMTVGARGEILTANRACHVMHGYEPGDLPGRSAAVLAASLAEGDPAPAVHFGGGLALVADAMPRLQLNEIERIHQRRDGSRFHASAVELPLQDAKSRPLGELRLFTDVTDRKRAAARIEHLALYDSLTGLPNRLQLHERTARLVAAAQADGAGFAVGLIDLDKFKQINDTLGHAIGDEVLRAVAQRLREALRPTDLVVRMGGDEFAVLLPGLTQREEAQALGERILHRLSQPAAIDGHALHFSGSVGLAFFPEHGDDLRTLLGHADAAMYQAKGRGRQAVVLFEPCMARCTVSQGEVCAELRQAITHGDFVLHYQPIVDAVNGKVHALEALVRWRHPSRGLVSPAEFIPLAEETGLIVPIGRWVMRQACEDLARLRAAGFGGLRVSVNVSPRQFLDATLVAGVQESLQRVGLESDALELEITESVLMSAVHRTQETLMSLRELGTRIAIDDFGTGYSSLSYLTSFPVQVIKIDRSFVSEIGSGGKSPLLVAAIVSMAHGLGLAVIAEGVETAEQHDHLRRLGCDLLQGYRFGRPLPYEELKAALGDVRPAAPSRAVPALLPADAVASPS